MADHHYHANHIEAPARGSKRAAEKDARRLHVPHLLYQDSGWLVNPDRTAESIREHGGEFPLIVRCHRTDCVVR